MPGLTRILVALVRAREAIAGGAPRYTVDQLLAMVIMPAYTEFIDVDDLTQELATEVTRGLFHLWSDGYHGAVRPRRSLARIASPFYSRARTCI